jgi:uncharacterized membrane protein YfcA
MGLALGLTGGGGAILTVPILVYLFGVVPMTATVYSLAIVGLVALWGAWGAYRSKDLHLKSALAFGVPGLIGVLVARRLLLPSVPQTINAFGESLSKDSLLLVLFSLLMLAASISMIRASFKNSHLGKTSVAAQSNVSALILIGLIVGVIAGFLGAGGGFLIVPALVSLAKLEMRQAVGTSLFVIALQSLLGVLGDHVALRAIDPLLFTSITMLALIGMSVGTRLRHRISAPRLKLGFGIFVLMMGTTILLREIW